MKVKFHGKYFVGWIYDILVAYNMFYVEHIF